MDVQLLAVQATARVDVHLFVCGNSTAVVFCFQLVLEDMFLNWEGELWFACNSARDSTAERAHNTPYDRDVRMRSVLELHDNKGSHIP